MTWHSIPSTVPRPGKIGVLGQVSLLLPNGQRPIRQFWNGSHFLLHSIGKIVKIARELATWVILFDVRRMAKEQKPEQSPAPTPDAPEVQGPPKSYRLHIALGFVSLILLQMIILYLLLPPRQVPKPFDGLNPVDGIGGYEGSSPVPPGVIKPEDVVERAIQEAKAFTGKKTRNDATETYSLVMHVTVRSKESNKFDKRYADCQQAIIDRVSGMLDANVAEYNNEVNYTTLKEKAKREINGVLGTPWVQSVLISNFTFESQ